MSTNFPTSLDALTNPISTDPVTSPSHAGQHANANDAIEALEAKVGVDSSAVTTSLDYKLKSTSSTDPGHKHTPTVSLAISGTPDGTKFLRDDNTWVTPSAGGDVTGPAASVDSEIAIFNSTTGKVIKRASTTGIIKATSGVISAATSGTDYVGISGGYAPAAQLGSGSPSSSTYLRGDQAWVASDNVVYDYLLGTYVDYNSYWSTTASSVDTGNGWTTTTAAVSTLTGSYISTNASARCYIAMHARGTSAGANMQWDTGPTFRAKYFWLAAQTSQGTTPIAGTDRTSWHGFAGTGTADTYGDITVATARVGFAYYNNTLYTLTADGSNVTANSQGGEPGTSGGKEYIILFNGGTSVSFYMNGALLATHTTNIPATASNIIFNSATYDAQGSGTGFYLGHVQISVKIS